MKTTPSQKRRTKLKVGESYKDSSGYIRTKLPTHPNATKRGYVMQHRLVLEHHLGRYLTPTEQTHHKNQIRDDNRIENLQLCANSTEHNLIHRPRKKCSICDKPHFGRGFCMAHYNKWASDTGNRKTHHCENCNKPLWGSYSYESLDGKRLCRACRWPRKKCRICGKKAQAKGLCAAHYSRRFRVPCSKCGTPINKSGRNHWPPLCWNCRFPKRKCRICGGKHMARGLCDNHWHKWKRGTL